MEKQKSKADILIEKVNNELIARGLPPGELVTREGAFVCVPYSNKVKDEK